MTPAIRNGLLQWMIAQMGDSSVVWADGNGPIPDRSFATMKITNARREGSPTFFPIDDEGRQPILQGVLMTLSVSVYSGGTSLDLADALAGSLNRTTIRDILRGHGVAFVDVVMPPTDTSVTVGTTFESRATFDLRFRANIGDLDPVGWIETVILTGRIEAGDRVFETTHTIGVN